MNIKQHLKTIALLKLSSVQCYRILLLLLDKEYTQAQISSLLEIPDRANVNKYVKELENFHLIEVARIEGKNKYLKIANLDKLQENIPGQIKIGLE